jgi:hypothetical protein
MKETLEQRLSSLQKEYETGQKMLADLDTKRANLAQTLLRIEGAMQVLRELLEPDATKPSPNGADASSAASQDTDS